MNLTSLVVVLSLIAVFAVLMYAILGKRKVDELRRHPNVPNALQPKTEPGKAGAGSPSQ